MFKKRRPLQHRPKTLDLKTFKAPSFPTESSSQAQLDFEDQNAGPYLKAKYFTALFNNMRTLKLKAQPTNAFFATVNQMFGGSSQLPTMLSELYSTI